MAFRRRRPTGSCRSAWARQLVAYRNGLPARSLNPPTRILQTLEISQPVFREMSNFRTAKPYSPPSLPPPGEKGHACLATIYYPPVRTANVVHHISTYAARSPRAPCGFGPPSRIRLEGYPAARLKGDPQCVAIDSDLSGHRSNRDSVAPLASPHGPRRRYRAADRAGSLRAYRAESAPTVHEPVRR
jgi:hypothetical protein